MVEQFNQANWKTKSGQSSVNFLKDDINVRQAKREPNGLGSGFGQPNKFRRKERAHLLLHEFELSFSKWDETPVLLPGSVVNLAEPVAFIGNIFQITGPNCNLLVILKTPRNSSQSLRRSGWIIKPPRIPILCLGEPRPLDQSGVVRRIVRRQNCWRISKTVDQQSADIVRRIIDRAHDFLPPFLPQPIGRRFQKTVRNVLIIDAIEEAEAAD